jgi:DNA-binding protein H-NS
MSATYAELKQQIAELERAAAAARKNETAHAIAQVQQLMSDYGLSIADIDSKGRSKTLKATATVPPKFKNPETNETWTGRGRAPRWLDGKDKEAYRIKE